MVKTIAPDGFAALTGGDLRPGDEVVMITRRDGSTVELALFCRPPPPPRMAQRPPPVKGLKTTARLGQWRHVVSPKLGGFFFHAVTGERLWRLHGGGGAAAAKLLAEELDDEGSYPVTLHVRRRPAVTAAVAVVIRAVKDAAYLAHRPVHWLTEAGPRGVADLARGAGRDGVSLEEMAGMRLLAKRMYYEARREMHDYTLVPGVGVAEAESEMTGKHEKAYRELVGRQRGERGEERAKAEARGEAGVVDVLMRMVDERHEKERRILKERQRGERLTLADGVVVAADAGVIKAEVDKVVHQQKLLLGAGERLRETELQRRRRNGRGEAGEGGALNHVASYSHAMPDTSSRCAPICYSPFIPVDCLRDWPPRTHTWFERTHGSKTHTLWS